MLELAKNKKPQPPLEKLNLRNQLKEGVFRYCILGVLTMKLLVFQNRRARQGKGVNAKIKNSSRNIYL